MNQSNQCDTSPKVDVAKKRHAIKTGLLTGLIIVIMGIIPFQLVWYITMPETFWQRLTVLITGIVCWFITILAGLYLVVYYVEFKQSQESRRMIDFKEQELKELRARDPNDPRWRN